MEEADYVKILKALADDTRFKIFGMLRGGTLCACKILERLNVTQPTLSHHMKVLCECGLVTATRDWKWIYYSIDCNTLNGLTQYLTDVKCKKDKCE